MLQNIFKESGSENTQENERICGNDYSNFTTESNQLLISLRVNGGFPDSRFQIFLEEITWVADMASKLYPEFLVENEYYSEHKKTTYIDFETQSFLKRSYRTS